MVIEQFQGEYRWLSNFYPVRIKYGTLTFPSVEHFYVAMKTKDVVTRTNIAAMDEHSAKEVKRLGKKLGRPDWDTLKLSVMAFGLRQKFNQEPFKSKLKATDNMIIEEGNTWNDTFWGVDHHTRKGENNLGKLIMKIRAEL